MIMNWGTETSGRKVRQASKSGTGNLRRSLEVTRSSVNTLPLLEKYDFKTAISKF